MILTGLTLPDLTGQLMRDRVPHLALRTTEAIGVVGPLVRPGSSACLNCVDIRKTETDPQWPKILAQATFARSQPQACDTVLAAMTATLASAQALAYLDRPGDRPGDRERHAGGRAARLAVAAADLAPASGVLLRRKVLTSFACTNRACLCGTISV